MIKTMGTAVDMTHAPVRERRDDVRRMLVERRRELQNEIQNLARDVRREGLNQSHHIHLDDTVAAEPEDDLAFALLQMKTEALKSVTRALRQFDEGTYGYCIDCGEVIASLRLRAMPFAVRCRDCEETLEDEQHRERVNMQRLPPGVGLRY